MTRGNPTPKPKTEPAAASRISAGYQTITCTSESQSTSSGPAALSPRSWRTCSVLPWNASPTASRREGIATATATPSRTPATVTATPVQVPPPGGPLRTIVRLEAGNRIPKGGQMAFEVPDLPYDYGALEPHID